jgi:N-acetylmuramoyl-L-alanine amidase
MCSLIPLAGCSTASRSRAPDWTAVDAKSRPMEIEHVSEEIPLAPPPGPPVLPPPAHPATNNYAGTWISLERWCHDSGAGAFHRISPSPAEVFSVSTSNGTLVIQPKTQVAKWDGLQLSLGFEPQLINGQLFVHTLDLKKNIEPLIHPFAVPAKPGRVIVIDPGHGGTNTGTTNIIDGVNEKEFTLDWADRLKARLAASGWEVFLTRTNDADISLANRVAFADEHKADLFISLHFNSAAPNQRQAGLETFCLTPPGMPSTLTRGYEDDASQVFPNNGYDAENLQLAFRLHQAVLKESGLADRGVRRARFLGVLRGQSRPAVLIEGGYLSNPQEARRIADPDYREKLAEAVAQALLPKPESGSSEPRNETPASEPSTSPSRQSPNPPSTNTLSH